MKTTAVQSTPPRVRNERPADSRVTFAMLAFEMTWKLAIVVLVPIIAGVYIDKSADTDHLFMFIGLAIAVLGSIGVMWQMMQKANSLPVPKLSADEKRKVQERYEEEDKEKDA